nr:hypothetical protein [Streptomyces hygroscopicus]
MNTVAEEGARPSGLRGGTNHLAKGGLLQSRTWSHGVPQLGRSACAKSPRMLSSMPSNIHAMSGAKLSGVRSYAEEMSNPSDPNPTPKAPSICSDVYSGREPVSTTL